MPGVASGVDHLLELSIARLAAPHNFPVRCYSYPILQKAEANYFWPAIPTSDSNPCNKETTAFNIRKQSTPSELHAIL